MTRRLLPAFLIALLVSAVFTWWLSRHLSKPTASTPMPHQHLLVAAHNLPAGQPVQVGELQEIDWAASQSPAGALSKRAEVQGRVPLYPLFAGEPITEQHLAAPGSDGLAGRIPEGMRAISLRPDEIFGSASFIKPGSSVDVLSASRSDRGSFSSSTVLQDVLVLALGDQIESDVTGKALPSASGVTLLVSPQDAEKLVLASSRGKLILLLRNHTDRGVTAGLHTFSDTSADTEAQPVANHLVGPARTVTVTKKLQPAFTVETVAGNKHTEATFGGDGQ